MGKRKVIKEILEGKKPPYVPWHLNFTIEAEEKLKIYWDSKDIEDRFGNHFLELDNFDKNFKKIGENLYKDYFGAVWDRSIDKDIGNVLDIILKEPKLTGYDFPNPLNNVFFEDIPKKIEKYPDRFRVFHIGFSLYERAWILRGMENLLTDMIINPRFVRNLFGCITDYNIEQVKKVLTYDIDGIFFGDDWGMQVGLQMGYRLWREFIYPEINRMYKVVKDKGKFVCIHCCGDVDELFDELIEIGLDLFNPFQPEVMDVYSLLNKYRGRLSFHGGMSTQKVLPFYNTEDVREETKKLIEAGKEGSYIFAPAHAVKGDVPIENTLVFIEELQKQEGFL